MRGERLSRLAAATCIIIVATGLLAGCAARPRLPPPPPGAESTAPLSEEARWAAHREQLSALNSWNTTGKVAYRVPGDAGSANLQWQQQDSVSELRLSGPLGAGSTLITSEGALLRVLRDGIERLYPADAAPWLSGDRLLPVPVASIRHWLTGVPDPTLPVDALQRSNSLATQIEQDGWIIRYDSYQTVEDLTLPARLTLQAPAANLTLKVILRKWELSTAN